MTERALGNPARRPTVRGSLPRGAKERILAGTLTALGQRGLHKVSIEDICSSAGLSRRTIYRYFDGREDIIAGIARHISQQFEEQLVQAIERNPDIDRRVRVVVEQIVNFGILHEDTSRLIAREIEFMRDSLASSFDHYLEMIRRAVSPIFATYPQLGAAGLSDTALAELIVRLAMQLLLMPNVRPQTAIDAFCLHWDCAAKGALAAAL